MIRNSDTGARDRRGWSGTATVVLLAFLGVGVIELGAHHLTAGVVCFVLAVAYLPARAVRGRLMRARVGR